MRFYHFLFTIYKDIILNNKFQCCQTEEKKHQPSQQDSKTMFNTTVALIN